MNLTQQVNALLAGISDPLLGLSIEHMGFSITADNADDVLAIKLRAGFPVDYLAQRLQPLVQQSLQQAFPQYRIHLTFEHFIKAHRTQLVGHGLRGVKNTIAIASGKGGVGKSTVAVNIAAALAKAGARVGILDADIYGPSIPMMLGKVDKVQISGERYLPVMAHGLQAMSIGYLTDGEQALIWRGPMLAKSLLQMLDITQWDALDYLFIDLPPGTGDIQLSLVQKIPLTAAIVVTTPQPIATLDAQKALQMFARTNIDVIGLIENMSSHICTHCGHHDAIFGQDGAAGLSKQFNIPLLGQLPLNKSIRSQADSGLPVVMDGTNSVSDLFMASALQAAVTLAQKPINYADKFPSVKVEH